MHVQGGIEQLDFVFPPLEPQFISNGERFPTTISRYWQSPADLTFYRHDVKAKAGGSLITQVFVSGFPAGVSSWSFDGRSTNETNRVGGGVSFWPGALPNTAQIIPPDTRSGIWCGFCVLSAVVSPFSIFHFLLYPISYFQGFKWGPARRGQSALAQSSSVLPSWCVVNSTVVFHLPCLALSLNSDFTCRRRL